MLARLTVPFADVRAGHLTWALAAAGTRPMATISVVVAGTDVTLIVLGASHQVEAHLPGAEPCVESVACGDAGRPPLPDTAGCDLGTLRYRFRSRVQRLEEDVFTTRACELRSRLAPDPLALVASFPGHSHALTGLVVRADSRGVAWQTWHAYPVTGELVHTSTQLVRR